ncbi:hypothetical protein MKX03_000938 [Papaver bracteatum]|nr:hypothetical protein MKX03_000938 [Papaver bracteatum]
MSAAKVRPLVTVQPLEGDMDTDSGNTVALLAMMTASIRPDIIRSVHANISRNARQPYAVSKKAGHQTSAVSWGTGQYRAALTTHKKEISHTIRFFLKSH